MELKTFTTTLKNNNALRINDELILFNDLELYSFKTQKSVFFKNYDELYNYNMGGLCFKDFILNLKEFIVTLDGGRGSGSSNQKMGGGFNHASGGKEKEDYGSIDFPARLNTAGQRYKSFEKTLSKFEEMYKNAEVEYGASIDSQGYAQKLIKGGSTSVPIRGAKGEMIIHNHPEGGNFSDGDLITVASGSERGIVATGSHTSNRMRYTFTKTNKFKAKEFIKAVKKAQWPTQYSYDKGADWWLRRNAKTYGYKYSAKKIK